MTGNVNFLTQNVKSETSMLDLNVEIDRKITFLCPLRYVFEASQHFNVTTFDDVYKFASPKLKTLELSSNGLITSIWHLEIIETINLADILMDTQ